MANKKVRVGGPLNPKTYLGEVLSRGLASVNVAKAIEAAAEVGRELDPRGVENLVRANVGQVGPKGDRMFQGRVEITNDGEFVRVRLVEPPHVPTQIPRFVTSHLEAGRKLSPLAAEALAGAGLIEA